MPTADDIRKAIDAGQRPHAIRLAREAAAVAAPDEWLELAGVLSEHAMLSPLVDAWRKRRGARGLHDREKEPFATALNAAALEHLREGRPDDALRYLDEALDIAPLSYIRRNLASALLQKGEFENALAELDELLSADPRNPQSLLLLGIARYQTGDPELAVEPLEAAAETADGALWLLKALCLLQRMDEATATLKQLADQHPDRAPAMIAVELAEPGSPLQALRDVPAAQSLLDQLDHS
jgi:tetratricopeptide (TPR) repeat protein